MSDTIKRIAIIGPESSGKSELCRQLASHYSTNWVPEYARDYLSEIGRPYTLEDIVQIYKTQFEREQELNSGSAKYLFIDTEFLIAKVWCEHVFKACPPYLEEMIEKYPYDLYLLTAPDLPWEYDPLRENPGKGVFFFDWYKKLLIEKQLNFAVVSGQGNLRTQCAIEIIKKELEAK